VVLVAESLEVRLRAGDRGRRQVGLPSRIAGELAVRYEGDRLCVVLLRTLRPGHGHFRVRQSSEGGRSVVGGCIDEVRLYGVGGRARSRRGLLRESGRAGDEAQACRDHHRDHASCCPTETVSCWLPTHGWLLSGRTEKGDYFRPKPGWPSAQFGRRRVL